ncbi:MAG: nucleotidyltransferase family protein [Candidatus Margulisiibacteriota bacterium]
MDTPATLEPQLAKLKALHAELPLCGKSKNALLDMPPEQFNFLLALLKDEKPTPPPMSSGDWEYWLALLASHNILPLLYWKIRSYTKNVGPGLNPVIRFPPTKVMELLQRTYTFGCIQALKTESILKKIVSAFSKAGINYAVLKGLAYAYLVYPDPGVRPGSDIDVLVNEDQYLAARSALDAQGFRCGKKVFETLRAIENEESFIWAAGGRNLPPLDLHWRLHSYPGMLKMVPTKEYLKNCVRVATSSFYFQTLSPEDSLLNAIIHLSTIHNQDLRLIWICDIAGLAKKITQLNQWPAFIEKCAAAGTRVAAEKMLTLALLWTDFVLPAEFADFSRWPTPSGREISAWENVTRRQENLLRWFAVRWPKNLSWRENVKLFRHVLKEKWQRLIK